MKQSAAKTLGVAALGAAFVAAGAGAAGAAPVPDANQVLDAVNQAAPVDTVAQTLPAPAGDAVTQAQPVADQATGLLGGLPVDPTASLPTQGVPLEGLATNGLPVNGLPL